MKIWEAIIYGIFGGLTELLPISFIGHASVLHSAFNLSPLTQDAGLYVHLAITIGVICAIFLAFRNEARAFASELLLMSGLKKRKRGQKKNVPLRRSISMGACAIVPMLLSLIFCAAAERITSLLYIAVLFAINGLVIYFCSRSRAGKKDEKTLVMQDALLIGCARAVSVLPGISGIGASLSVGRVRGLAPKYNLRLGFLLSLVFGVILFFYRLIRAIAFGNFSGAILLPMLLAMICATVFGYLAIQYLKYLLNKDRFNFFAFYSWDAAVIVLFLALINF